jgi:hypothetical protein
VHGGAAAGAGHAPADRLGDPVSSLGHRVRVEARAAVADVDGDLLVAGVDEGGDLRGARVLRGVRHRLTGGEHERLDPLVERRVAGADDLDRKPVQLLHLGRGGVDRRCQAGAVGARRRVEPRPQLALLPPRERGDAARVAGLALDERQGLEDGVVHACGHLGALLLADARRALGVPLGREAPRPGADHEQERDRDGARLERGAAAGVARVPVEEEDDREHDQDEPGDHARPLRAAREQDAGGAERGGPDDRVREAEAAQREHGREGERDQAEQAARR